MKKDYLLSTDGLFFTAQNANLLPKTQNSVIYKLNNTFHEKEIKIMKFEKINLLSKKFNREFEVEGYTCKSEAGTVISTNSLKRVFETVKNEMKIKTSYTSDVRTSV